MIYFLKMESDMNMKTKAPDQLSAAIRFFRRRKGLSQTQLAQKAGLTQTTISEIEKGVRSPTVDTVYHISNVLGLTLILTDGDGSGG